MWLHSDGSAYTSFADAFLKYPGSFFFGTGSNAVTGAIIPGPFLGTSALRFDTSSPNWSVERVFGNTNGEHKDYIISFFLNPMLIPANIGFLQIQDSTVPPNLTTTACVQISPAGQIWIGAGFGDNVFVFPAHWNALNPGAIYLKSRNLLPFNKWTHVCIQFHLGPPSIQPLSYVVLWINGCVDTRTPGVGFPTPSLGGSNVVALNWLSDGSYQLGISQYFITDLSGTTNNSGPISPTARCDTIFPNADGSLNNWTPSTGTDRFACVDDNPGPGGNYISAPGTVDQLFGIPAVLLDQQNLVVAMNMCLFGAGQSVEGLFKVPAQSPVAITPAVLAPTPHQTLQAFIELNPFTSAAWKNSVIGNTQWGVRGVSGSGEHLEQYFLERIWQEGPATCGGSYTSNQVV